jgi:pilus assembly protein CpaB
MDRRFLTVLGVSLIFALVVSTIFYRMTANSSAQAKKQEPTDVKDVVVAVKPLPVGVNVKPADVKTVKYPVAQFPKGAFMKVEEVIDRPVISNILIDEPVLEGRLAPRGSGLGLAPIIPVGMRAVTVRVSDVVGVAGFVLPGLRVDVLVTGRPEGGTAETGTTTVLQNILVLSAGQTMTPDNRGAAITAANVTLLVTPEQAEVLTLAGSEGRIQLVLRNGSDQTIEKTPGAKVNALYKGFSTKPAPVSTAPRVQPKPKVVVAAAPVAPPPPPPPAEVIMIRGNQRSVEVVGPRAN